MLMRTPPEESPERRRRGQHDANVYVMVVIVAVIAFAVLIAIAAIDLGPRHAPISGDRSPAIVQPAD